MGNGIYGSWICGEICIKVCGEEKIPPGGRAIESGKKGKVGRFGRQSYSCTQLVFSVVNIQTYLLCLHRLYATREEFILQMYLASNKEPTKALHSLTGTCPNVILLVPLCLRSICKSPIGTLSAFLFLPVLVWEFLP